MRINILFTIMLLVSTLACGQASPAATAKGTIASSTIEINYSSPRVKGRVVFGELVPYEKVWRAGANKNTTISFDKAIKIEGKDLAAGTYGFFIIPNEDGNWIAIFSKKNDAWGSGSYIESDDALRVDVKAKTKSNKEEMTFDVTKKAITFAWANKSFKMNVTK